MGDVSEKKIVIDSISGSEEGQNLIGCYFKAKPDDKYNFHDKDDSVKHRDITVGSEFTFTLDEMPDVVWHLTLNSNADEKLIGNWWDSRDPSLADGEYQAQAGGSGEEEDASAASAGGYTS